MMVTNAEPRIELRQVAVAECPACEGECLVYADIRDPSRIISVTCRGCGDTETHL